jgi:hypothetical protein
MTRTHKIAAEVMTFEHWEERFDAYVIARTGMGYQDFSDFNIRSCYDSQMTLQEAFAEMMEMQDEDTEFLMNLFG